MTHGGDLAKFHREFCALGLCSQCLRLWGSVLGFWFGALVWGSALSVLCFGAVLVLYFRALLSVFSILGLFWGSVSGLFWGSVSGLCFGALF